MSSRGGGTAATAIACRAIIRGFESHPPLNYIIERREIIFGVWRNKFKAIRESYAKKTADAKSVKIYFVFGCLAVESHPPLFSIDKFLNIELEKIIWI